MTLQTHLEQSFLRYKPVPPDVVSRSKHNVTLTWSQVGLAFLQGELLFQVQRKDKIPPWVMEYSGGQTAKRIDNLAPCCPHKFRLRVIVKATAVSNLADLAIKYYGSEEIARERLSEVFEALPELDKDYNEKGRSDFSNSEDSRFKETENLHVQNGGDTNKYEYKVKESSGCRKSTGSWLESQWSELMTTNTESVGASAVCFCTAVLGGYLKHVQVMLEERPELVGIINSTNGFTPLITAVRRGDIAMVRYLLSMGAEVDQRCTSGQAPLHVAILCKHTAIADLLLEKGADFQSRDSNEMRAEHYAVDSGDLFTLRHVLDRGGDVTATDSNRWTPLFRAVVQGSSTAIIEELVRRGSDVTITDRAGLPLAEAAHLLSDRHGRARESILRLVNSSFPREKAVAAFTRITKKISTVNSLARH